MTAGLTRFNERKADFLLAVTRLQESCAAEDSPFVRDSVIQRFEFCWELAWKLLQLRLAELGVETRNPRDTWQESLKAELIDDGNAWTMLQKMRNLTSHTYDETLAAEVYHHVKQQGLFLFVKLAETVKSW